MKLETERLVLRKFKMDDLDELAEILGNEEVMHFSISGVQSREGAEHLLKVWLIGEYEKQGYGMLAVIHKKDKRLIGLVGFKDQQIDGEEKIELAYRLHPKYWGQGLAQEAALAVSHYAFDTLGLDQLISIIEPKNSRSLKLAHAIGMHFWKDTFYHGIFVHILLLDKVTIHPYDPEWPAAFQKEEKLLKIAFQGLDIEFYHIGSTAIPDCWAKPIIDILAAASDISEVDQYNEAMKDLGFEVLGEFGMKGRRYFRKRKGVPINLHIFQKDNPEVGRHLRFRDYLRNHPEKVSEYSELKKKLAIKYPGNRSQYTQEKDDFIREIDALAKSR